MFPTGTGTSLKKSSAVSWEVHSDLVKVPSASQPVHAAFDHHQRDAAVLFLAVRLDRRDDEVGIDAVGDERLRAVNDVVVSCP